MIDQEGEISTIVVDSPGYFRYIEGHFEKLVARLRDPSQTLCRQRFEDACKLKWNLGGDPRVIAL